ncbi:MAG: RNA methyltransferase [Clostridia bacterium]|nr:RNA methyltransferase [Clostridia bacterium]
MRSEESRFEESLVFEGMTSIRAVINVMETRISDRRIEKVLIDKTRASAHQKEISYLESVAPKYSFEIEYCKSDAISDITVGNSHGGIVALCSSRTIKELSEDFICRDGFYVMIEGIEDPYNFGYAIRSIYSSGADGIILTPRNWMSAAGVVCRSSAGASELIDIRCSDPIESVKLFKSAHYKVAAAGIRDSVSAYEADLTKPLYLIVGGEKRGISRALLDECDMTVRLDCGRRFNASLSAASAASILSFEVLRQNKK